MTLPRPVTTTDLFLAALLTEIRGLRADMAQTAVSAPPPPGDLVNIKEPGTPLPTGFPGLDALAEAGIVYYEAVPRDGDALTAIPGIGRVTAGKILAELA